TQTPPSTKQLALHPAMRLRIDNALRTPQPAILLRLNNKFRIDGRYERRRRSPRRTAMPFEHTPIRGMDDMSELDDEAADIRPSTTSGIRLLRTRAIPRALIILLGAAAVVITVAGVRAVAWAVAP